MPRTAVNRTAMSRVVQPRCSAASGLPAPRLWPTRAVAVVPNARAVRRRRRSIWLPMEKAATAVVEEAVRATSLTKTRLEPFSEEPLQSRGDADFEDAAGQRPIWTVGCVREEGDAEAPTVERPEPDADAAEAAGDVAECRAGDPEPGQAPDAEDEEVAGTDFDGMVEKADVEWRTGIAGAVEAVGDGEVECHQDDA